MFVVVAWWGDLLVLVCFVLLSVLELYCVGDWWFAWGLGFWYCCLTVGLLVIGWLWVVFGYLT